MKPLQIIAVAARPPTWATAAQHHYQKQIKRFQLVITAVKPSGNADKEADAVLAKLPKAARCILLEVGGKMSDSDQFAASVASWLDDTRPPVMIIGGADGVAAKLSDIADERVSLSQMTFPHNLARLILVEQLFRADCLMRGHPYPR